MLVVFGEGGCSGIEPEETVDDSFGVGEAPSDRVDHGGDVGFGKRLFAVRDQR